ncbi:hypothetical protein FVEG_12932 [Fusarium verticillioides 7600]|uniref:Uncharacterized protein n=1 Tax=Gibberella moniliformis (strain M3125 / FGSC 7600) TaxID=334819 RepID=W7MTM6_GIBM7|nr:hypothetical protein FVEG_12932 [Fusarium verticillioides 7600]EWG54823.1 hypothetical protein FVEG_12932 [Fusarium verticillioides 7600]
MIPRTPAANHIRNALISNRLAPFQGIKPMLLAIVALSNSWCFFRISESAAQLNCWMNLPVQRIFAVSASCFIKSCHRWPEATGAWFRPRSQAVVREEKMRSLRRMSRSVVVKRMWLKFEAIFVTFLIILHAAE